MRAEKDLSQRQAEMLSFIIDSTDYKGYPPTIREIGRAIGISSTSVVNYNLSRLCKSGDIEKDPVRARGIRIPRTTREIVPNE